METYTTLGALILPNELGLLEMVTGLGFAGGMVLILVQIFWLDQPRNSEKDPSQVPIEEGRRSYQRITLPGGMVEATIPALGVKFQSTVWNISRSGISIIAPKLLRKGSVVSMGIRWFGMATELYEAQMEGSVAFCLNGNQFSILGIAFNKVITESDPNLFRAISTLEAQ